MSTSSPTFDVSTESDVTQPPGSVNIPLAIALPICLFFFAVIIIVVVVCLAKRKSCSQRSSKPTSSATSRGSVEGSSDLGDNNNDSETGKHHSKGPIEIIQIEKLDKEPKECEQVTSNVAIETSAVAPSCDSDEGDDDDIAIEKNLEAHRTVLSYESEDEEHSSNLEPNDIILIQNIPEGQRSSFSVSEDDVDDDATVFECQALFPYNGSEDQDLTFNAGDRITAWKTLESGWWYGKCGDNVGWFPGLYVKRLSDSEPLRPSGQAANVEDIPVADDTSTQPTPPQLKDLSIVSEELNDSDSSILQELPCPSPTINGDGSTDAFHVQTDFPEDGFPSDRGSEKSIRSPTGRRTIVSQLSLSKLVKSSGLHKLKMKKSSDVAPDGQILETPGQTLLSSSSEVAIPNPPTAKTAPRRPTQPPPEIPKISLLPTSVHEVHEPSGMAALFENTSENSAFHDKHELSSEILSSSARSTKTTELEFQSSDGVTSNDDTNDIDGYGDINAVITPPPPDEFATVDAETAARFNQWDSVLGSFDRILESSFNSHVDAFSEANSVGAEALVIADDRRNEHQKKTPAANNFEAECDADKIAIDLTLESPRNNEGIHLLPYAPVGYNDSKNMEDLSSRFLEYFSRGVGNLDSSRLRVVVQPSPSCDTPQNFQPEIKETFPKDTKPFLPPKPPKFPKTIAVETLMPASSDHPRNSDDTEYSDSVIKFLTPDDDLEYNTIEGEGDEGEGLGDITFVIPQNGSNSSRLSTTVLRPDVVRGLVSLDDCGEDMLIPPPSEFTNLFVNLNEDVDSTVVDEGVKIGLASEITENDIIDNHASKVPRYFARTLFNAPAEHDDKPPLNPSAFEGRTPGPEPVKSQVTVVMWRPWSQNTQAEESGLSVSYGSGPDNVRDWYASSQLGILFRVENGSVEFDESEVGVESIV